MANPLFPNVPVAIGVPIVNRLASAGIQYAANTGLSVLTADVPGLGNFLAGNGPQWGIFDLSGNAVVIPDSIRAFDYRHEWRVANYPMEKGAFQSYNKVQTPFEPQIILTKGGTDADRAAFLSNLEAAALSTALLTVTVPEVDYSNVTITAINYRRNSTNGATLLTVEVQLQEIREAPASAFSNTTSPADAVQVNTGIVQSIPVTTGSTATASSIEQQVTAGTPLSSVISSATVQASNASTFLTSPQITSVLSTVTPYVTNQIKSLIGANSPATAGVLSQFAKMQRIQ